MLPKTIIHLLSGGMDSVVLLYDLHSQGHKIHALLYDYGQKHSQELKWARYHCDVLDVLQTQITLPLLRGSELTDGRGSFVVPNRNAIFISVAVNLAVETSAETITLGCNKVDEESFPDCRRGFFDTMNTSVKAAGYDIEICAPYLDKPKWWIAGLAREMKIPLNKTWSCYRRSNLPCGVCPACVKHAATLAESLNAAHACQPL